MAAEHGGGVRGAILSRRSPQFEGRFGRLFRALPAADFPLEALEALAAEGAMSAEPETTADGKKPAAAVETDEKFQDAEENSGVDAGYTYFGQFIDHDITFDPASSLVKVNDPDGLTDFRTPRLDLDCLYGRGPDDQPYMFTSDGGRFLLGDALTEDGSRSHSRDLARHHWSEEGTHQAAPGATTQKAFARALIGDKRNDENVIVSQLQGAMLQFHNRIVDDRKTNFADTQREVRWTYQYVVLNDYLPRIVGKDLVHAILPHLAKKSSIFDDKPKLRFYKFRENLFIPIEFSTAAYRFGHSMVRPIYRLNTKLHGGEDPNKATKEEKESGLAGRFFIFAGVGLRGLNGFREFPRQWAIDWSLFFDINGSGKRGGPQRVQPAYKIDTSLVNPLAFLPEFSQEAKQPLTLETLRPPAKKGAIANLAERNLKRGLFMSLPSGQDIARAMGETALTDDELRVGKATFDDAIKASNPRLVDIAGGKFANVFADNAPLWFYVLAEALEKWRKQVVAGKLEGDAADRVPVTLGAVGGRLVAETLIGLLIGDSHSFLSQAPNWTPRIPKQGDTHTVGDVIKYALKL
jgi:hypothetical protein